MDVFSNIVIIDRDIYFFYKDDDGYLAVINHIIITIQLISA